MEAVTKNANGQVKESVEGLEETIAAILGTGEKPGLTAADGTINALYKDVEKADVAPTAAQAGAFARAERELNAAIDRWVAVKAKDLPEVNRRLRGVGLPELRLDLAPSQEAGGTDED
jgi:hypothetical protein